MTKYHPLYAYAVVSVILVLGIQMMISDGPSLTGLAVGDQSGQQNTQNQQKGFFQKVGNLFGLGDTKDTTGQAGAAAQGNKEKGTSGQTSGTSGQTGSSEQQLLEDDGTDTDTDSDGTDTDGDGTGDADDKDNSSAATGGSSSGTSGTSGSSASSSTNTQNQEQAYQQISDESKACITAIEEEIKDCSKEAIQYCLDNDATVDCIFTGIGECKNDYKDDKDACFEEASS